MLARTVVLALLMIAPLPGRATAAHGLQVRIWPLVDYGETAEGWSLNALGPLLTIESSGTAIKVVLRPLGAFAREGDEHRLTLLYPLLSVRWNRTMTRTRLMGFGAIDQRDVAGSEEWTDYVRLPPVLYYRAGTAGRTSIAIFPFYVDLADVLGQHRILSIAFPLFARVEADSSGSSRTWAPFPFLSVRGGPAGSGFSLWPLLGWHHAASERSTYVLWPLFVSSTETRAGGETEESLLLGPLYWRLDSPSRRSRGVLGFGHTADSRREEERWDFPWPLWHFDRGRDYERLSLRPFFVASRTPAVSTGTALWPLYHWQTQTVDGERHAHREILLGLWQRTTRSKASGAASEAQTLFPFYRYHRGAASSRFVTPAVLDALFPKSAAVRELYAPLWQLFSIRSRHERTDWNLLWGALAGEDGDLQYPFAWHFDDPEKSGG